MDEHRTEYAAHVQQPFYAFIEALAPHMLKIDAAFETRPHKCLARIHRDTRFSKDKSPYRDHLWLAFRKAARPKEGAPFYWFELSPETITWGLGVWGENRPMMDAMRSNMLAHPTDYLQLLSVARKAGFALGGADFKRLEIPPGLDEGLKPLYIKKEVYFERISPKMAWAFEPGLVGRVAREFKQLKPLYLMLTGLTEQALDTLPTEWL